MLRKQRLLSQNFLLIDQTLQLVLIDLYINPYFVAYQLSVLVAQFFLK